MLRVPPEGHPIRALVDVKVVEALTPDSVAELPTVPQAREIARKHFKCHKAHTMARQFGDVNVIHNVLGRSEDGRVILIGFGPRGSFKLRWNFGRIETVTEITRH